MQAREANKWGAGINVPTKLKDSCLSDLPAAGSGSTYADFNSLIK
jgi:hypothetical protein